MTDTLPSRALSSANYPCKVESDETAGKPLKKRNGVKEERVIKIGKERKIEGEMEIQGRFETSTRGILAKDKMIRLMSLTQC